MKHRAVLLTHRRRWVPKLQALPPGRGCLVLDGFSRRSRACTRCRSWSPPLDPRPNREPQLASVLGGVASAAGGGGGEDVAASWDFVGYSVRSVRHSRFGACRGGLYRGLPERFVEERLFGPVWSADDEVLSAVYPFQGT